MFPTKAGAALEDLKSTDFRRFSRLRGGVCSFEFGGGTWLRKKKSDFSTCPFFFGAILRRSRQIDCQVDKI
jgi:hypothetical protein